MPIYQWLTSVTGAEGYKAAVATGNLLLHSGKAGSLHGCLATRNRSDILKILLPPFPTPTSALAPGSNSSRNPVENHITDLSLRLKSFIQLVGGLTAGLLCDKNFPFDQETIITLETLVNGVKVVTYNIIKNNHILIRRQNSENKRKRRIPANGIADKSSAAEVALDLIPPLAIAIFLLEEKIEQMRRFERSSDTDSWDLIEEGSAESDPLVDEQMGMLHSCQESLTNLVGHLTAKAMIVGGGEVSTLIWRAIISSFDLASSVSVNSHASDEPETGEEKEEQKSPRTKCESSMSIRNNLLCRLAAIVLNLIIYRRRPQEESNPWTTIELCSATARLCDLVEEKNLLNLPPGNEKDSNSYHRKMTLDQVRLLCALLDITKTGRENTGWCQLILPSPPSSPTPNSAQNKEAKDDRSIMNYHSLLDAFEDEKKSLSRKKFVDHEILSDKDEIYDITTSPTVLLNDERGNSKSTESTYESIASSKLLLPILQPTLRVILSSLVFVRGVAVVVHRKDNDDQSKQTDSLLSIVVDEISNTITAAIVGLAFSNARDVCLNTLSALRHGIRLKDEENDKVVAAQYHTLFLSAINEMRIRYEGERSKRKVAQQAYGDETDAEKTNQVEILLMGNALTAAQNDINSPDERKSLINQDENEDFIAFPHDQALESGIKSFASPRGSATLGWNNYKGFGKALEECCKNDTDDNVDSSVQEKSDAAFSLLSTYLRAWDERQLIDDEDTELLELFDTKTSLENRYGGNQGRLLNGYNTAADSMSSFIGK